MDTQAVVNPINEQEPLMPQRSKKTFPAHQTHLAKILSDAQYRRSFRAQLKRYNPLIVVLYRIGLLPLFGSGKTVMLLTTRGRKSGKLRSTPIGYFRLVCRIGTELAEYLGYRYPMRDDQRVMAYLEQMRKDNDI